MAESTDVDVEGLDSATGSSSWRDSHSCWMGSLWLVGKDEFAKIKSKISLRSVGII